MDEYVRDLTLSISGRVPVQRIIVDPLKIIAHVCSMTEIFRLCKTDDEFFEYYFASGDVRIQPSTILFILIFKFHTPKILDYYVNINKIQKIVIRRMAFNGKRCSLKFCIDDDMYNSYIENFCPSDFDTHMTDRGFKKKYEGKYERQTTTEFRRYVNIIRSLDLNGRLITIDFRHYRK